MEIQQLQAENEQLKAQIAGLSFNLTAADNKVKEYTIQLEALYKQNLSLTSEVNHLNMLASTSNYNKNDSRLY